MRLSLSRRSIALRLALALTVTAAAAACGEDLTAPTIEQTSFAASLGVNLAGSTKTASGLYYRDVTVGTGDVIAAGDSIAVRYNGYLASGFEFDNNTGSGEALFRFRVARGAVIAGFDEGVRGMRVGGTRQLIIPPELGYGGFPQPGIPANSILVFTVQVVSKH